MEILKSYLVYHRTWGTIHMHLMETDQYVLMIPETGFVSKHIRIISTEEAVELIKQTDERVQKGKGL